MPRGGARPNAGRKKLGEGAPVPTRQIRKVIVPTKPVVPRRGKRTTLTAKMRAELPPFTIDETQPLKKMQAQVDSYNRDIHPAIVRELATAGLSDGAMADACKVSLRVFDRWMATHREFMVACQIGKEQADARVERVLYQKVVGYEYDATKIVIHQGQPMAVRYREFMPPDSDLIKYWLGNRKREFWQRDPERYAPAIEVNNITNVDNRVQAVVSFDPKELRDLDENSLARLLSEHLNASEAAVVDEEVT